MRLAGTHQALVRRQEHRDAGIDLAYGQGDEHGVVVTASNRLCLNFEVLECRRGDCQARGQRGQLTALVGTGDWDLRRFATCSADTCCFFVLRDKTSSDPGAPGIFALGSSPGLAKTPRCHR